MNYLPVSLKAVDRVEILTLIDNYVDLLLPSTDIMTRPPLAKGDNVLADTLLAEHGMSLLVTVYTGEKKNTILFDTGYTKVGVLHNMEQLEILIMVNTGMLVGTRRRNDWVGTVAGMAWAIPSSNQVIGEFK